MSKIMLPRRTERRGFYLVEILVVVVLLAALGGGLAYYYAGSGKDKNGKSTTPMGKAKDTVCQSNLRSVRQSIQVTQAGDTEGKFPATIEEMRLPQEVLICAVGKEPYVYDPQTGQVHCPHPGHENF